MHSTLMWREGLHCPLADIWSHLDQDALRFLQQRNKSEIEWGQIEE